MEVEGEVRLLANPDGEARGDESLPEETASGISVADLGISEDFSVPELMSPAPQEMDESVSIIQNLVDDALIPQDALEGADHSSVFYLLGTRYNGTVTRYKEEGEILSKKYAAECSERKRLYNELIEARGNIRVFCRCRPLSSDEISKGFSSTFDFDPIQEREMHLICSDNSRKQFKFDHVFDPKDSQEAVFTETLPIVKSVLDGYNACIFAYGQTGTGKTFTMEGTEENRGVNYRTLEELFRVSCERASTIRYEFFVSMLEVYNEKIRDLLEDNSIQPAKKLDVKQTAEGTQEVPGLIEAQAYNTNGVWELLRTGGQNRSVGSTNANELSSRSHCLLRVTIKGENLVNGQRMKSHLWLVDLAGSERVGKIEAEGERLKESQFINKSLSALGDVISALASKNPHIPYRNSKLTHLLQSSLGGDCKTLMFVQISPSSADLGETLCSLNFATRVRGIEQGQVRKQPDIVESFKYKQMAEKLRQEEKENAKLNDSLQMMHLKYASRENVIKSLQEKVREIEAQLADERRTKNQEGKESFKFRKPPLPAIKERPPLRRITNNLPPSGLRRNSLATTIAPSANDKENALACRKTSSGPLLKAQRISLAPFSRPAAAGRSMKRASIATMFPSQPVSKHQHNGGKTQGTSSITSGQRRKSVLSFLTLPTTPIVSRTPIKRGRLSSVPILSSNSKYCSPPQMHQQQASWRSKIPTFASPRRRLRLLSSPAAPSLFGGSRTPAEQQTASKLCFSVQKRLVIGSSGAAAATSQDPREKEIVGGTLGGGAQRVLCKNKRRMSVL